MKTKAARAQKQKQTLRVNEEKWSKPLMDAGWQSVLLAGFLYMMLRGEFNFRYPRK